MIKNITIDSLSIEDTNAMFEKICEKIAQQPSLDVKKRVLKLTGNDKNISDHKVGISELLIVISVYDIPVELKLKYSDGVKAKVEIDNPGVHAGMQEGSISQELAQQKKEVKPGDLPETPSFMQE